MIEKIHPNPIEKKEENIVLKTEEGEDLILNEKQAEVVDELFRLLKSGSGHEIGQISSLKRYHKLPDKIFNLRKIRLTAQLFLRRLFIINNKSDKKIYLKIFKNDLKIPESFFQSDDVKTIINREIQVLIKDSAYYSKSECWYEIEYILKLFNYEDKEIFNIYLSGLLFLYSLRTNDSDLEKKISLIIKDKEDKEEYQKIIHSAILSAISNNRINKFFLGDLLKLLDLSLERLNNFYTTYKNEVKDALKDRLLKENFYYTSTGRIMPLEFFRDSEVIKTAKESFFNNLEKGNFGYIDEILKDFDIPKQEISAMIKYKILELVESKEHLSVVREILKNFSGYLDEEFLKSQKLQAAVDRGFLRKINHYSGIKPYFLEPFQVSREILEREDIQEKIFDSIKQNLEDDQWQEVFKLSKIIVNKEKIIELDKKEAEKRNTARHNWHVMLKIDGFQALFPYIYQKTVTALYALFRNNELPFVELINFLPQLKNVPGDLAIKIIGTTNRAKAVLENLDNFIGIEPEKLLVELYQNNLIQEAVEYNARFKPVLDKDLQEANKFFGALLTPNLYKTFKALSQGLLNDELKEIGVTAIGKEGIKQLVKIINEFKTSILKEDINLKQLLKREILLDVFKKYVRYTESEWGNHKDSEFTQTIKTREELRDKISPLNLFYKPSEVLNIKKADREKQLQFEYSKDFLLRYNVILNSIKNVLETLSANNKPLSLLVKEASEAREGVIRELESQKIKFNKPEALVNVENKLKLLKGLKLRSVKDFQKNFTILSQFKEFHELLRQTVFYIALHKHKTPYMIDAAELIKKEKPTFDDISWMINFLDHIVNQETMKQYFTDKEAVKAFRNIINTKVLEGELYRAQNQTTLGTLPIKFIPTRGLLMEFSGHIADACWASTYESIAKEFPNFTAVSIVSNPDSENERLAGSMMLIETLSKDDKPLLIIRGLNPTETFINKLSVEDFMKQFLEYAKNLAKTGGRELAIVIDKASGGAGTNRPIIQAYEDNNLETEKITTLKFESDTSFNGYNIVEKVYKI